MTIQQHQEPIYDEWHRIGSRALPGYRAYSPQRTPLPKCEQKTTSCAAARCLLGNQPMNMRVEAYSKCNPPRCCTGLDHRRNHPVSVPAKDVDANAGPA